MVLLVTEALTQEEPQLHVQPGAAGGDVSMDGRKQGTKLGLPIAERLVLILLLEKLVYW